MEWCRASDCAAWRVEHTDDGSIRNQEETEGQETEGVMANKSHDQHGAKLHPGFKSVQASIAKREGISSDRAGAILASASRHASASAHKANPRLNRVKGK